MNFYILENDKPKKLAPGPFYALLEKQITPLKTDFNTNSIASVVQFVLKKEEINVEGEAEKAVDLIRSAVEASVEIEKGMDQAKKEKASQQAEKKEKDVKEIQVALVDSEKFAITFQKDTELSIKSRIAEAVSEDFDVSKNGGLVLKKGAKLEHKNVFTAIQGMKALSEAGGTMRSKSNLALADIISAVDSKHGEDFYAQLMDEKGKPMMKAASMVGSHFPSEVREKLDPKDNLGFSHWQELAGKKGFSAEQRQKLAKFVAKNGASKDAIRNLAKSVSELKDEEKDDVLAAISKVSSVEAATELVAKYNVITGQPTGEKASHLYITIVDKRTLKVESSNDWNEDMARAAHGVVVLGPNPKFTLDNLNLAKIAFTRTAPEVLPDLEPTQEEMEEAEPYASIRIYEKEDKIWAAGTVAGITQNVEVEGASTVEEGVTQVRETFGLDENNTDAEGQAWEIRTSITE